MTKKLITQIEKIKENYLEDLRDNPVLSDFADNVPEDREGLTSKDLTDIYYQVIENNCSEYEDIWYIAGCIQALNYLILLIKNGEIK